MGDCKLVPCNVAAFVGVIDSGWSEQYERHAIWSPDRGDTTIIEIGMTPSAGNANVRLRFGVTVVPRQPANRGYASARAGNPFVPLVSVADVMYGILTLAERFVAEIKTASHDRLHFRCISYRRSVERLGGPNVFYTTYDAGTDRATRVNYVNIRASA